MNGEIKRKIDGLRDLLVGKIPVPTDQVKQITLGLIYKFMSDIDEQNRELGGSSFFSGDYQPYAWKHILDHSLSAYERVILYSEGLEKMSLNPGIPQLFRDIFKGAFLPFKDPATVDQFLKGLNGFEYQHSEDLGDAYEYLLSIMGSQGDAGQFRTPRHIIDFIVAAVQPQKEERVLDPACGTAGFLVSAYKFILKENTLPGSGREGSALTAEERKRLTQNFVGYDISQDMTRISLVNMYLHQFSDPHIYEYDTLSSLERWDEVYDCILTNPPFMSPKGGIQPHNRFGVKSSRSEVLFVDYILEHLSPQGRAGIIVPEGIIFQSGNAYKQLRRKLVEEGYLYAVVSLPAGVFQPYSGVKTSILLIDRRLAQQAKDILFLKVEADGFDLGAQRKPIKKDDLPEILKIIQTYKSSLQELDKDFQIGELAKLVQKVKIFESGDFVLNSDRYLMNNIKPNNRWDFVELGNEQLFKIESGGTPDTSNESYWNGKINWATLEDLPASNFITELHNTIRMITEDGLKNSSAVLLPAGTILFSSRATIGRVAYTFTPTATNQGFKNVIVKDKEKVDPRFVAIMLKNIHEQVESFLSGSTYREISKTNFEKIKIPLPPLEVQRQIVTEIEGWQKVIDGARQVVANWKPEIKVEEGWPKVKMGDLCTIVRGSSPRPKSDKRFYGGAVPRLMVADVTRDGMYTTPEIDFLTEEGAKLSRPMKKGSLIMAVSGQPGLCTILSIDACIHDGFIGFRDLDESKLNVEFAYYVLMSMQNENNAQSVGAIFKNLTTDQVGKFEIPIPPLDIQRTIIDEINEQQKGVEACRRLIEVHEAKIRTKIGEVWGE